MNIIVPSLTTDVSVNLSPTERAALAGIVQGFQDTDRDRQNLINDAYFGTGGFQDGGYLWRHERESKEGFAARVKRREYRPYFKQVQDASYNSIFSTTPKRESTDARYKAFLENCDAAETDLNAFMAKATGEAERQGATILVMDSFENTPETLATALEDRNYPYVFEVRVQDVEQYAFDLFGNLVYLKYCEAHFGEYKRYRVYLWVDGQGLTWTEDTEGGTTERRTIPVFPKLFSTGQRLGKTAWPVSAWAPLAETMQVVYNLHSLALTQEFQSTFNLLTVNGAKGSKDLTIGEDTVLYYPVGSDRPGFIHPNTETLEIILEHLEKTRDYIYQVTNQALVLTTANASGESRKWADRLRQEKLAFTQQRVQDADEWVSRSFHQWVGSSAKWSVRYTSSFEYLSLSQDLEDAQKLLDLGISTENARRVRTDALLRKFSDADQAAQKEIAAAEEENEDFARMDDALEAQEDGEPGAVE